MGKTWQSRARGRAGEGYMDEDETFTGGEECLAESPAEKAGVSEKSGSSRKKRGKTDPGNFLQKYLWG